MAMAQQRFLRPSDFGDARFADTGAAAHRLYLALRVIADDRGVVRFRKKVWKAHYPLIMTANIRPTARELVDLGVIREYEIEGRVYWAIKDFVRDFGVSRPGFRHPLPDELWEYVGWSRQMHEKARDRTGETRGRTGGIRNARPLELDLDFTPPPPKPAPPPPPEPYPEPEAVAAPVSPDQDSAPKPPAGKKKRNDVADYFFRGVTVKLIRKDYDKWKIDFSKVPDFDAALRACDDWVSSAGKDGARLTKWYMAARGYMAKRHQEWAAKASPGRPSQQHPNSAAAILRRLASAKRVPGAGGA